MTVRIQVSSDRKEEAVEVFRGALDSFPPGIAIDLAMEARGQPVEPVTVPGKWQYQIVGCKGVIDSILNKFGDDGWEVCAFMGSDPDQGMLYVLKRPKRLIELASAGMKVS